MISLISVGTSMTANMSAINRDFEPGAVMKVEVPWETKEIQALFAIQSREMSLNGIESANNSTAGSFSVRYK